MMFDNVSGALLLDVVVMVDGIDVELVVLVVLVVGDGVGVGVGVVYGVVVAHAPQSISS